MCVPWFTEPDAPLTMKYVTIPSKELPVCRLGYWDSELSYRTTRSNVWMICFIFLDGVLLLVALQYPTCREHDQSEWLQFQILALIIKKKYEKCLIATGLRLELLKRLKNLASLSKQCLLRLSWTATQHLQNQNSNSIKTMIFLKKL